MEVSVPVEAKLMMARYYEAGLGRFLSVDPSTKNVKALNPQTWNRYVYASNSPLVYADPTGESDADARKALEALKSEAVQKELASAMEKAGYDETDATQTREASGGIAEVTADGKGTGQFVAYSEVKPSATPNATEVPTKADIATTTGGNPVADLHTHQLAGRIAPRGMEQTANPDSVDRDAATQGGLPQVVVSRTQVTMAWVDDNKRVQSRPVMTFSNVDALKAGKVEVKTPKILQK